MKIRVVERRSIWWPTLLGWGCFLLVACSLAACYWFHAESWLSITKREPAEVLVVEGWIGLDGLQAAKAEFDRGDYHWLVTVGASSNNPWDREHWNYADEAQKELVQLGLSSHEIIVGRQADTESQRTFASAVAAWRALRSAGIKRDAIDVFTQGVHARRSRLVFAKVFGPTAKVGVVAWRPADYATGHWWHSSERADELIKETAGYLFEALLNSCRTSNSPAIADRPAS